MGKSMADLVRSLLLPGSAAAQHNSSQESFHSMSDQLADVHEAPNPIQDVGQVFALDEYLSNPANVSYISTVSAQSSIGNKKKHKASGPLSSALADIDRDNASLQPIEINKTTSHHVSALYLKCQNTGITPIFEINGECDKAKFQGVLKLGDKIISLKEYHRSKKEVKEKLAEQGLAEVERMIGSKYKGNLSPGGDDGMNWVGKLQEYHNQCFGSSQSPVYTSYGLGSSFACTCAIPSHPDRVFGTSTVPYPSKKQARARAAAEAVKFLIAEGQLNADGSTLARKKPRLSTGDIISNIPRATSTTTPGPSDENGNGDPETARNGSNGGANKSIRVEFLIDDTTGNSVTRVHASRSSSHAQRVNELCPLLGLTVPQYQLACVSQSAPNLLSGHATFSAASVSNSGSNRLLDGKVGEACNVFGKKAAKEEVAKGVWEALVKVAESRGVSVKEV